MCCSHFFTVSSNKNTCSTHGNFGNTAGSSRNGRCHRQVWCDCHLRCDPCPGNVENSQYHIDNGRMMCQQCLSKVVMTGSSRHPGNLARDWRCNTRDPRSRVSSHPSAMPRPEMIDDRYMIHRRTEVISLAAEYGFQLARIWWDRRSRANRRWVNSALVSRVLYSILRAHAVPYAYLCYTIRAERWIPLL